MIVRLNEKDNEKVMAYVKEEEEINLYIIGYIEKYGYDKQYLKVWGQLDEAGQVFGVLMLYYNDFVFYSKDNFDVDGFVELLKKYPFQVLAGKKSVVKKFEKAYSFSSKFDTFFCRLDSCVLMEDANIEKVKKMKPDNLQEVVKLYDEIEEFENNETDNIALAQRISDGCGRGYFVEEKGEVLAAVQTTAEQEKAAMVVSVATNPKCRKLGYSSLCMTRLCKDLREEGKKIYLYYYNEQAGRIYRKLGFKEIERWTRYGS